jgi:hypothetical protein
LDHIDVFIINSYSDRIPEAFGEISDRLDVPIMIGECHFGSLEAPLAGMPNCVAETEAERGDAFRIYQEDAAAKPWCVGTHYFTLYDKSSLGRPDGENYNQGVVDTTNALSEETADGVRTAHERLYRVFDGELDPFDDEPDYLHDLYL